MRVGKTGETWRVKEEAVEERKRRLEAANKVGEVDLLSFLLFHLKRVALVPPSPVQKGPLAAVVFNILHRFENRSILGRGQKGIAFCLG